jgi:hypothetical protein
MIYKKKKGEIEENESNKEKSKIKENKPNKKKRKKNKGKENKGKKNKKIKINNEKFKIRRIKEELIFDNFDVYNSGYFTNNFKKIEDSIKDDLKKKILTNTVLQQIIFSYEKVTTEIILKVYFYKRDIALKKINV